MNDVKRRDLLDPLSNAALLKKMRTASRLSRKALAYQVYRDINKNQRIGKIEREEIIPTAKEVFRWYEICCKHTDSAVFEIFQQAETMLTQTSTRLINKEHHAPR